MVTRRKWFTIPWIVCSIGTLALIGAMGLSLSDRNSANGATTPAVPTARGS